MRPNLHSHPESRPVKTKGELRLIFLSRLAVIKQLHVAIESLRNVRGNVVFDIYGTLEQKDKEYYYQCRELASTMSANVSVHFCGEIDGWKVGEILCQYHAFFLPTLSENYGHAIAEALSAGCPVVISDQTPWQDLAGKGIGWDVPVGDVNGYAQAIQTLIDMDAETYERFSGRARQFGDQERLDPQTIDNAKKLFLHAMKD
ncbi:MAG: glycosyltransferase [Planctomycetaceae bacterium]|nr:glycosyltransferase [Planctomycetaceae bacterium]